jgi:hypothetical protein
VRRRMLWAHVERHRRRVKQGFSGGGYFDLMHRAGNADALVRTGGP